jgi:pimeloyl-ACP methyl ester carboxylesterase
MRDFSDDIHAIIETLALPPIYLVGHSMGGCVAMQYTIDHPAHVASLSLVSTGSPYGFGGTKDRHGTPCWPDYAGSGGGLVHPEVVARLQAGDPNDPSDFAARSLVRNRYVKPPFRHPREDALVAGMVRTATSEWNYSRDMVVSSNWPNVAPGTKGVNNALSPKYCNLSGIATIEPKPPVFWIRGADDQIVSDTSASDPGVLGAMGILPGWPGADVYPSQPMVSQVRAVFEHYQHNGGSFQECVIANVGHMPHIEDIDVFLAMWLPFLQRV